VLRGIQHSMLLFTGHDDHARLVVQLCRIAERIQTVHPGV
jgi:hypothetical protein